MIYNWRNLINVDHIMMSFCYDWTASGWYAQYCHGQSSAYLKISSCGKMAYWIIFIYFAREMAGWFAIRKREKGVNGLIGVLYF